MPLASVIAHWLSGWVPDVEISESDIIVAAPEGQWSSYLPSGWMAAAPGPQIAAGLPEAEPSAAPEPLTAAALSTREWVAAVPEPVG